MTHIERGTEIGSVECSGCGAEVPLKVNSAGGVYYFCARVVGERNGKPEKCMTRFNLGRQASERMKQEFLNNQQEEESSHVEQVENREEERTEREEHTHNSDGGREYADTAKREGQPDDSRQSGGITAGLKHFFTGDE